jgi:threonine aldolase
MPKVIDLRSDTVTKPTPAMRQAMAQADVGDDVFGEDPTVNRLQARAAELFGREAALFVPSGVMGNQIAIKVHTQPGDEVILEEASHIFNSEMAMMAAFSGVIPRPISQRARMATLGADRTRYSAKSLLLRPDATDLSGEHP